MAIETPADPIFVLAPAGRDARIIASMVREAGLPAQVIAAFDDPAARLADGAGLIVAAEAFDRFDARPLYDWLAAQPPWSDFPIIFVRRRGAPVTPQTRAFIERLGNVSLLARPLRPITLASAARSVVRARRRQREAEAFVVERLTAAGSLRESEAREKVEATMTRMQRMEAVGQLTAGVAHDFNNLLTVVLGNLTQLERRASDDDRRRLAMMRIAAESGAKLTGQLLAFSRRQRLEPKPTHLNDAILSLRDLLRSTLGAAASLETWLERAPWPALVDPTQIEMIILNLAINARDAMPAGGKIRIETANTTVRQPRSRPEEPEPGDYVMLCVTDNGEGMKDAVLQRALEPFFTTKEVGRGSGLGLSQVLGFCKQSGGGVRIETKLGRGTSVFVYLPRAQAAAQPRKPSLLPQQLRAAASGGAILLVDDDEAVRDTTGGMLKQLGFQVIQASSGGGALEILGSDRAIDLMLVDFAMPGMNGAEVARAAIAKRPGLPILFVTGYADLTAITDAGHPVIRKPFEEEALAEELASLLGERDRAAAAN